MRIYSFFLTLLWGTLSHLSFGQASWDFSVWFNLQDQFGQTVGPEDFYSGNVKLLSSSPGVIEGSRLSYNPQNRLFRFSQHTLINGCLLSFVCQSDTTLLMVKTRDLYLPSIELKSGFYCFHPWLEQNAFECQMYLLPKYPNKKICTALLPFEFYQWSTEKEQDMGLKYLPVSAVLSFNEIPLAPPPTQSY